MDRECARAIANRLSSFHTITEAQEWQAKYVSGKDVTFEIWDRVWLSIRNICTTRPSKNLNYKRAGQYTVSKVINKNAYKLDIP
jgi:hypothetical protein